MEPKRRGRPPKSKNKESPTSVVNSNNDTNENNTNVTNNTNTPKASPQPTKSVKTPPAGYMKCKHKGCKVYCEDEDTLRRHMEDFKYHRRHYKQLGDTCLKCLDLAGKHLWRCVVQYRELISLSRDLMQLVETTRNTAPVLEEQ